MGWITGKTLSPASGELVFTIGPNCELPGPQTWQQFWKYCDGPEPIFPEVLSGPATIFDDFEMRGGEESKQSSKSPAYHLSLGVTPSTFESVEPADAEPQSKCSSTKRTVTFQVVNFDINDGGDSIATSTGSYGGGSDSISIFLRTRGTNPSRDVLNAAFPSDLLRAIAWHESRWAHFLPSGKPKFLLNTNGTTDWGLMQINQATFEQHWNWMSNLARGAAILAEKRGDAERYLNRHPEGVTEEMFENETIQRYNGGRYYDWDEETQTWLAKPANGYVAIIRGILNTKPW